MKVLLIGHGAREHAIAEAITRSVYAPKLYAICSSKNPGILKLCRETGGELFKGDENSKEFVSKIVSEHSFDFVFIGPEEPLFHGISDTVEEMGIPCIGAKERLAEVERSKAYMRRLMWKHKIPGRLKFIAFKDLRDAITYIEAYAESVAIKPARQAGGKGVKVISDFQAYLKDEKQKVKLAHAKEVVERLMSAYDDIEDRILIEEKVEGPEYTMQCFTDGRTVLPMPAVQDNKNAFNDDIGPETGGMGSISGREGLLPFLTKEEYSESVEIVEKVVHALHKETGERYHGLIAGQMMLTDKWGPTIIEFYSRFGDPEAVNVLPILETDMIDICEAIISESLHKIKLEFRDVATVVKCVAAWGYPNYRDLAKGHPVHVDESIPEKYGCKLYYGAIDIDEKGQMISGGSRLIEIFGEAETIPEASEKVEKSINCIQLTDGWRVFHRSDIGTPELLRKRIDLANLVRMLYHYRKEKGLIGIDIDWIPGKGKIVHEY